jgi:hypothetical protein
VLAMPEMVSMVTGNHTASAIKPTAENIVDGETTIASGIQAVAGIGPTTFNNGMPQYRMRVDQPMQTPVIRATATPKHVTREQQQQGMPGAVEQAAPGRSPGFAAPPPGRENKAAAASARRR